MITTSGRRRSVSATAEAPSAASPMTRIFGEREEREAEALAHDLVVVRDEAGDLVGHVGDSTARRGRLLPGGAQTASRSWGGSGAGRRFGEGTWRSGAPRVASRTVSRIGREKLAGR